MNRLSFADVSNVPQHVSALGPGLQMHAHFVSAHRFCFHMHVVLCLRKVRDLAILGLR
jgi:hypothetical protein